MARGGHALPAPEPRAPSTNRSGHHPSTLPDLSRPRAPLTGRPTDVPWAVVFPGTDGLPRHPSQIYEALLEGLLAFVILYILAQMGALRRPGVIAGVFAILYGAARIFSEFFREPDPQLGYLRWGLTMGMVLSLPLIITGIGVLAWSFRRGISP